MASISWSVTGVRFGWREALPPVAISLGAAGTSDDLEKLSVVDAVTLVCDAETAMVVNLKKII